MLAKALTPILNVSDIQGSFAWFEKLGWKKNWDCGDPPTFVAVQMDIQTPDGHVFRISQGIGDDPSP